MAIEFVTVARLRAEMAKILAKLRKDHGPLYLTQRGEPRAVLLAIDEYGALIEQLEYLDDSIEASLARERREGGERARPLEDVIRERRQGRVRTAPRRSRARPARARVSR